MNIYKKIFILSTLFLLAIVSTSFSFNNIETIDLYINNIKISSEESVIRVDNSLMVPIESIFNELGAQVFYNKNTNIIASYHLNTYLSVDIANGTYHINGKDHYFKKTPIEMNRIVYVPLELLIKIFDLNIIENDNLSEVYLKANSFIQYKNYNNIPYRQISLNKEGIRYSIPLYWESIDLNTYGYNTSYGTNSINFNTRFLNENIDMNFIINTYKEHLTLDYGDDVVIDGFDQKVYNYLTSNVLYITTNVNENSIKKDIHFIEGEGKVHIITFTYSERDAKEYISNILDTIMNSLYIDESSVDTSIEHYIEYGRARQLGFTLNDNIYSNMTLENHFILNGHFNTDKKIDSLTVTVSKDDQNIKLEIPVFDNSFYGRIYTPFGLGKHNIKIEITLVEEKLIFSDTAYEKNTNIYNNLLAKLSVINISDENIRYKIPTAFVESNDKSLISMSNLLSYKHNTSYNKAQSIYNYVKDDIDIISISKIPKSAKDVYLNFEGTKKEINLYLAALLRAQDIPSRIIEGSNEDIVHYWTEAYLNGKWIIIDPKGDSTVFENNYNSYHILEPGFSPNKETYVHRYSNEKILPY